MTNKHQHFGSGEHDEVVFEESKSIMAQLPNQLIMEIIKKSTELKRQPFSLVLDQIKNRTGIMGGTDGLLINCYADFWTPWHPENFEAEFEWNINEEYEPTEFDHPESILTLWGAYC
jgi:hypothetical protein